MKDLSNTESAGKYMLQCTYIAIYVI